MSFASFINHGMTPGNSENVWLYAKKRMKDAKQQMRLGLLPPKTLRLISFLVFNKEFGVDMLIKLPLERGWPNQYIAFSSIVGNNDCYNFSVHTRFPYRSTVGHMSPVYNAQNFFLDIFYDYQNQELVLHDPKNYNRAIDFDIEEYSLTYYQRLIDDFKSLHFNEELVVIEGATFLTKRIDESIRIGIDIDLFKTGRIEKSYQNDSENTFCFNGLLIQFDEDDV